MKRPGTVLGALTCCALAVLIAGCTETTTTNDANTTTVKRDASTTTVTAAMTSSTVTVAGSDGAWIELEPGGDLPSARQGQSFVCDDTGGQVFLLGGETHGGELLNDTWAYQPATNTWTELAPAGDSPSERVFHAMVYDPGSSRVILFGGWNEQTENLNDTWAFDPAANAWTELDPSGELPPSRRGHTLVYDPASGRVILFGGYSEQTEHLNDTWAYDPAANTWTELDPAGDLPGRRSGHCATYDPAAGMMIVFGGVEPDAGYSDTWAYEPAANTWTELHPAGDPMGPRWWHSLVYDPVGGKVLLFGGWDYEGGVCLNDLWGYESPSAH